MPIRVATAEETINPINRAIRKKGSKYPITKYPVIWNIIVEIIPDHKQAAKKFFIKVWANNATIADIANKITKPIILFLSNISGNFFYETIKAPFLKVF